MIQPAPWRAALGRLCQNTLLRFVFVGGAVALLYAVLAALATSQLALPKTLSAVVLYLALIPLAFWLQRRFTFATSTPHRHAPWLYAATQALGVGMVAVLSHLLASGRFWPDLAVHLVAATLAALISFAINRLVVFPRS